MVPNFTKLHNKFKFNDEHFTRDQLIDVGYSFIKEGEGDEKAMGNFLLDWLDDRDYVLVPTSGSTRDSKMVKLKKQSMVNSAIVTGNYFNLHPGSTALHCLSSAFIAGKMMMVRALILGLDMDIRVPSAAPLDLLKKTYDFCAMAPMQLQNSLHDLHKVKTLIVGGAPVSGSLQAKIQDKSTAIFGVYGMTETLSHVAVKPLNHVEGGPIFRYTALPGVSLSTDNRNCLVIKAPWVLDGEVVTNDIVNLHSETEFEFLGRYDNVINSGGIKIFPERIEKKLGQTMDQRFFVISEKDEVLGERLVLIVEGNSTDIGPKVFAGLDKYERPKAVYAIEHFEETTTKKIKRTETLALLNA
jgi:O-succinylbenzoic acid--CoA ligase